MYNVQVLMSCYNGEKYIKEQNGIFGITPSVKTSVK